ncbi:MAG: hypothetical protein F4234_02670 [Gammaproteobacteria bacterium]|nr:hypothetical protein [Gammaproteobacteria bacterium]
MFQSFASSIADSGLNRWIAETYWLWPVLEIIHFIGLSIMLGALLIIDVRLLGMLRSYDTASIKRLVPLIWFGFCINLASGTMFFVGDPMRYSINIGFQLKMVLILIPGLTVVVYQLQVRPQLTGWNTVSMPTIARLVAITSLATWGGVLLLGRLIPYVGTG